MPTISLRAGDSGAETGVGAGAVADGVEAGRVEAGWVESDVVAGAEAPADGGDGGDAAVALPFAPFDSRTMAPPATATFALNGPGSQLTVGEQRRLMSRPPFVHPPPRP